MSDENEVPRYYANWVTLFPSAMDLAVHFGYYRPTEADLLPDAQPRPEWVAEVALSWEEAVILREALSNQIDGYEREAGPIRRWEGPPPTVNPETNGHPRPEDEDEDDK